MLAYILILHRFRVPPQDVIDSHPEILIICPCGLNLEATRKEYEETLLPSEWWPKLAENATKIALVDGNQASNSLFLFLYRIMIFFFLKKK